MKKLYIFTLILTLSVSACDTFDKTPSAEWPSEGAIATVEDLQYAVNGVYQSQTSSIDLGTNPRGSYAGDFGLYADMRGSDFSVLVKITKQLMYPNIKRLKTARTHLISISVFIYL